MKYQNIILISVFTIAIIVFYLVSCMPDVKKTSAVIEEKEDKENEYYSVNLRGEFERTGSFLIPSDWTVEMLFEYAGVKKSGDTSNYILTDLIVDNKEYFVPKKSTQTLNNNLININTATASELTTLYGIGAVLASNIIEYRAKNPFTSIEDIKNVKGIGEYVYEKIKTLITV